MEPFIFWFNCAFCGAHPQRRPFAEYLERWKSSPESDFDALLDSYRQILLAIRNGRSRWLTKKFVATVDALVSWFDVEDGHAPLNRLDNNELFALVCCPVCGTEKGRRPKDKYFTEWGLACRVQVANLLYEAGIVIFSVLQELPRWANPERMGHFGDLLFLNEKAMNAISLLDCPFCGRKTTCLYGDGTATNPHRCRWCLNASGDGPFVSLGIVIEADGSIALRMSEPPLPSKVDATIVPWHVMARIRRKRTKGGG